MGRPAKNEIMNPAEMDDMNLEILNHSRLYDKDTSNSEKIAVTVDTITDQLLKAPKRIELGDVETVRGVTVEYLRSCSRVGLIPSKIGLARSLGCTRAAVDKYIQAHPDSPTADFLGLAFDAFGEMLTTNSLNGCVHPIVSIFLSKCLYHYVEQKSDEEQIAQNPLGPLMSAEQIEALYRDLPAE